MNSNGNLTRPVKRFAIFFLLWIVLTGGDGSALVPGVLAAGAATWFRGRLSRPGEPRFRLMRMLALVPGFFWRSFEGGLDVAWRAFHPKLPLDPGWILCRPHLLPPGAPRVVLGGEISLLPGTLVAGTEGDSLLVHCLDRRSPIMQRVEKEESRLAGAVADG
jgi:multicomponent Na+:H+ antiporter subunit E